MSLAEIKNALYKREEKGNNSPVASNSVKFQEKTSVSPIAEDSWAEKSPTNYKKIGTYILYGLMGAILVGLLIWGIIAFIQSGFKENRVILSWEGADHVISGQTIDFEINLSNENRSGLKNSQLRVTYPSDFHPEEQDGWQKENDTSSVMNLGSIKGYEKKNISFSGRAFYPKGSLIYLNAELIYTNALASGNLSLTEKTGLNVYATPIALTLSAPEKISSGNEVDYEINYSNTGSVTVLNAQARLEYPDEFIFQSSQPASSASNNLWDLGSLKPGDKGKIIVSGKLSGGADMVKTLRAYLGANENGDWISYDEEKVQTVISASPIIITQKLNGSENIAVNAGDNLDFQIKFKNADTIGYRNAILTVKIDSPVLDYSSLKTGGGYFDGTQKTITWKASNIRKLANFQPNDEETIDFSIKIKNFIPVGNVQDKNFIITSLAQFDSPDINSTIGANKTISSNEVSAKLNSKLILSAKGYYNDALVKNNGPLPPNVNQETTYTFHWLVSNVSNDVTDAKVEAELPNGVSATGLKSPDDADIVYDSRTNKITWTIGKISAGAGILSAPKEVAFQIKFKPSITQSGKEADLLGASSFSAHDTFTDALLSANYEKRTTYLPEDSVAKNNSQVISGSN